MNPVTRLIFSQLQQSQAELHQACDGVDETCPTDLRYAHEWDRLRDYIDTAVFNISAFAESNPNEDLQIQAAVREVFRTLHPAANALLEGYLQDLAGCEACGDTVCPLSIRARDALMARDLLDQTP